MPALLGTLTGAEASLVRETERDRLAGLTEDDLVELHTRIRRARDKYVKMYRRQSAARVTTVGTPSGRRSSEGGFAAHRPQCAYARPGEAARVDLGDGCTAPGPQGQPDGLVHLVEEVHVMP